MELDCQSISIYGDFVTSLTAYYSCADIYHHTTSPDMLYLYSMSLIKQSGYNLIALSKLFKNEKIVFSKIRLCISLCIKLDKVNHKNPFNFLYFKLKIQHCDVLFFKHPSYLGFMYSKQGSLIILLATVVGMANSISISSNAAAFGSDVREVEKRAPYNVK